MKRKKYSPQDAIGHVRISLLPSLEMLIENGFVMKKQSSLREVASGDRKDTGKEERTNRKSSYQEWKNETRYRPEQQ